METSLRPIEQSENSDSGAREKFLSEFVQLKADACYIRDYRDYFGRWVTCLSTLRVVTSTGSIAGWLIWEHLAWLWAALIGAAQLAEALTKTFPFAKKRLALSRWCRKLDELVVAAQGTWDEIEGGKLSATEIRKALKLLRSQKQKAQAKAIPNGLPRKAELFKRAQEETQQFFRANYNAHIEE